MMIEPTEDEKANGWTAETLTEYLRERKLSQAEVLDPAKREVSRPMLQSRYHPHRWRS